eukprot:gene2137-2425_t
MHGRDLKRDYGAGLRMHGRDLKNEITVPVYGCMAAIENEITMPVYGCMAAIENEITVPVYGCMAAIENEITVPVYGCMVSEDLTSVQKNISKTFGQHQSFICRYPGCFNEYRYEKVRINHEKKAHSFDSAMTSDKTDTTTRTSAGDDVFNYCTARLNLAFLIRNADDAVKEGDEEGSAKRESIAVGFLEKMLEKAQKESQTASPNGHHKTKKKEDDMKLLVPNLFSKKIFEFRSGRKNEQQFKNFNRHILAELDVSLLSPWLTDHLKQLSKKYPS